MYIITTHCFVVTSWTKIPYTSDLLSDDSLKHGVAVTELKVGHSHWYSEGGVEVFVEYYCSFVWVMYCHIVVIDEVWFELRF